MRREDSSGSRGLSVMFRHLLNVHVALAAFQARELDAMNIHHTPDVRAQVCLCSWKYRIARS